MELKELHAEMQRTWAELKSTLDKGRADDAEKVQRLNARLDELEAKMQRPPLGGAAPEEAKDVDFLNYLRKGVVPEGRKDFTTDSDPNGGIFIPVNRRAGIIEKLVEYSPLRELATVETISVGNSLEVVKEGSTDFDCAWTGERTTPSTTQTNTFAAESIPTHEMYAKPRVTQRQIDDSAFDIEGWLSKKVAQRFGVKEATAFITGTGVGQPEGLMTNSGISSVNSGSATAVTADGLVALVYNLPEAYARNASFLMKRATLLTIRQLKESTTNAYIWQPGLQAGAPPTILGHRYYESPDMAAEGSNAYPVAFGDFKAGYTIVDRMGISVLRDPFSSKPFIEFYTTRRVGGQVVLAEAIRKLKCST